QTENAILAPEPLEREDFFIHPAGARGARGADDDLTSGFAQRRADHGAEVSCGRQLFSIPENGRHALWHRPLRGGHADEVPGRPIRLERAVQPRGPLRIAMAVAQKCPILRRLHASPPRSAPSGLLRSWPPPVRYCAR